jgi:hypothetical protein
MSSFDIRPLRIVANSADHGRGLFPGQEPGERLAARPFEPENGVPITHGHWQSLQKEDFSPWMPQIPTDNRRDFSTLDHRMGRIDEPSAKFP